MAAGPGFARGPGPAAGLPSRRTAGRGQLLGESLPRLSPRELSWTQRSRRGGPPQEAGRARATAAAAGSKRRGSGTTSRRRPLRGRPGPCARAGGGRRRKWAARWCGRGPGRWLRRPGRRCGRSPSAWQGSWSEREISQRKRAGAQYARFVVVCYNKIRSSRFLWDGIPNHWTGPEQTGVVFNSKAAWLRS